MYKILDMKNWTFLITLLCFIAPLLLVGQIQKGGKFMTASLAFSQNGSKSEDSNAGQTNNNSYNYGSFGASVGYQRMVTNRWAIGGGVGWNIGRSSYTFRTYNPPIEKVDLKSKNNFLNLGLTAHYFYPLGTSGKWLASVGGYINYGIGQGKVDTIRATGVSSRPTDPFKSARFSIEPSIIYAFSKHFFLQANLANLSVYNGGSGQSKRTDYSLVIYPSWGSFSFLYYWD